MSSRLVSRRESLLSIGRMLVPGLLPRVALAPRGQQPPGDILVCLFFRGGMDGLSAVPPYGEGSAYYDVRKTIGIPPPGSATGAALDLDGFFGLHPALGPLKGIYDAGGLAIVQATGGIDPTRSHFDAMRFTEAASAGDRTIATGWIGRHLMSAGWQNDSPLRAVGFNVPLQASLRGSVPALAISTIADFRVNQVDQDNTSLENTIGQLYSTAAPVDPLGTQAKLVFETISVLQALSNTTYTPAGGAAYTDDGSLGTGLKQVAQLIKAGLGLEVACVDFDGWDTHNNQGVQSGQFFNQMTAIAKNLSAFYTDLGDLMQNVTVVTMSEFGRRVEENASHGTDHGHGNVMFVMSGGVRQKQVYAKWPSLVPDNLDDGDLAITTDNRHVLAEIVQNRLKNNAIGSIFPGFTPTALNILNAR